MPKPNLLTLCETTPDELSARLRHNEAWLAEHAILRHALRQLDGYNRALTGIENDYLATFGRAGAERVLSDRRWQQLVRLTGDLGTAYWRSVGSDPN